MQHLSEVLGPFLRKLLHAAVWKTLMFELLLNLTGLYTKIRDSL